MPCYDDRTAPENVRAESQATIDKLTRLLCEACAIIDEATILGIEEGGNELQQWWLNHQAVDAKRELERLRDSKRKFASKSEERRYNASRKR